jgi:ribonuclease P protein component
LARLSGEQAFSALMRRRPLASNDWLMIYALPVDPPADTALGFVIPKKSLRRAVQRNRVRRWARAYWQGKSPATPHHLLVRCRGKAAWSSTQERQARYREFTQVCDQAAAVLALAHP